MRNYQFWYYIKMEMTTVALVNSFITILRNMYLRVIIKSFKIFRIFLFWQAIVAHYIIIGTIIKNRSHTYRAIYPKSELLNLTQRYVLTFTLKVITGYNTQHNIHSKVAQVDKYRQESNTNWNWLTRAL